MNKIDVSKLKLLHLVKSLDIGGVEKSTILYSNELSKRIDFVGIFGREGFYDRRNLLINSVSRIVPPKKIEDLTYFLQNIFFLTKAIKRIRITHIHYHQRIFIPYIFILKLIFREINFVYSHQNVFHDWINYFLISDKIIALTQAAKSDLPKFLQKKTTIIPHGILIPKNLDKKIKPCNFGYVGRFVEWKRVLEFIDEFKMINAKYPYTKLFLVGDGPLKEKVKEKTKYLALENHISIIDPQYDLTNIYNSLDILVLPSKSIEGFGIVLVEAMAYSIPVIVYDIPSFEETVMDNYNGIIAKGSLFDAMSKILITEDLYSRLSTNARMFSKKYAIEKIIARYLNEIYL